MFRQPSPFFCPTKYISLHNRFNIFLPTIQTSGPCQPFPPMFKWRITISRYILVTKVSLIYKKKKKKGICFSVLISSYEPLSLCVPVQRVAVSSYFWLSRRSKGSRLQTSELLPVCLQLSPYYAERFTGFFNLHFI